MGTGWGTRPGSLAWVKARQRTVLAVIALLVVALAPPALGTVNQKSGGTPTVEGPITGGLRGAPFGAAPLDLAARGYVEAEYFISGTAKTYTTPSTTAAYKTRILVRRPANIKKFNGTVVIEWTNVTGTFDSDNEWMWSFPELMREGYAFAAVSAQQMGVQTGPQSLRFWDPVRYGSLNHPGDDYSFDIFTQAVRAVMKPRGVRPLANLRAQRVLAAGQSQSAARLYSYIDLGAQKDNRAIDAFLIDAGGATTFPNHEPDVPTIHFLSEDGISPGKRSKASTYRLWQVPGAAHIGAWAGAYAGVMAQNSLAGQHGRMDEQAAGRYGEEGGQSTSCVGDSEYPRQYAIRAAIHQLNVAMNTGRPLPASPPEVSFDSAGKIVRDAHGNAVGGVRLPPLDVPVATYVGATCGLRGETKPFDDATLHALYRTHAIYMGRLRAATRVAVQAGFLRPADANDLLRRAQASSPRWSS